MVGGCAGLGDESGASIPAHRVFVSLETCTIAEQIFRRQSRRACEDDNKGGSASANAESRNMRHQREAGRALKAFIHSHSM